jgi:hypothetical protein
VSLYGERQAFAFGERDRVGVIKLKIERRSRLTENLAPLTSTLSPRERVLSVVYRRRERC